MGVIRFRVAREGRVNIPNVVRVVSRDWLQWLEQNADRPARPVSKPIGVRNVAPTDKGRSFPRGEARAGRLDLETYEVVSSKVAEG
jgi:hypothetical protein